MEMNTSKMIPMTNSYLARNKSREREEVEKSLEREGIKEVQVGLVSSKCEITINNDKDNTKNLNLTYIIPPHGI